MTAGSRFLAPHALQESQARIEDHALIGDLGTAALVTRDGTIDWMCAPAFDSEACFAALLGTSENGYWKIAPSIPVREVRRRYRSDTLILETDFITDRGSVRLIDFMPPHHETPHVIRTLVGLEGEVPIRFELAPRFAFGSAIPKIEVAEDATKLLAGPDALYLRGGRDGGPPPTMHELTLRDRARVSFVLAYGTSYKPPPSPVDPEQAERATELYWRKWVEQINPPHEYRDAVVRSLIVLKACIYEPTGAIVAAPTTSLPETPGGVRNWDYRFCWIRDASLTLGAFMVAGIVGEEVTAFRSWLQRAIAGDLSQLQIMYGIRGERRLTEAELPWLPGYGGAKPVRVGNAAYDQFQLDVLGEAAATLYSLTRITKTMTAVEERSLLNIADFVGKVWKRPDRGIWEMRGPERHFTASKVAAWTAVQWAIRAVEEGNASYPLDILKATRREMFEEICREGYSEKLGTFTQYYGGTALDASLLFIPLAGFLPANDPRVVGTVAAIERELLEDGLVLRFRPVAEVDGLSGDEGVFLACSFWLANTYCLMGRKPDARRLFERVLSFANDVGLLSEEYDPREKRQLGNFPQAFSHFALVRSAYFLAGEADPQAIVH